jgi:hypothetical protein
MSDPYFAPMYGGLMNHTVTRGGSRRFGAGSGFYGHVGGPDDPASPFSTESLRSPIYDTSPHSDMESSYFGFHPISPRTAASLVDLENFSFKRLRSLDSGHLLDSPDASPVSRSSKASKTEANQIVVTRKRIPAPTQLITDEVPILKLGDDGRAKLKSALSELSKSDEEVHARIEAIGKIRLASMQQLMQMAKVSGLWEYALTLAREHEMAKAYRRSS